MEIQASSSRSRARLGKIETIHGNVETPCFLPIATRGAVKGLDVRDLHDLGASMILSNTYHLFLNPGLSIIEKAGGLHRFIGWNGPILTDSGGYQVFSLGSRRRRIGNVETMDGAESASAIEVTTNEEGALFRDPKSGNKFLFSPEEAISVQRVLGSDIAMVLDVCLPYPSSYEEATKSTELTLEWAKRSKEEIKAIKTKTISKVFGIIQGSTFEDLRKYSARETVALDFDGYAIGGVAVGEPREEKEKILEWVSPLLPEEKPRYLMGMGFPEEIVNAVKSGIDLFDCVLPTRNARHGNLFVWKQNASIFDESFYSIMRIRQEQFKNDFSALDQSCKCLSCANYSRAFLRHLFATADPLGPRLGTLHNLFFYLTLIDRIKQGIRNGEF